ncbi:hypothetical protein WDW89_01995 [Deltaproteobacteria bacterium TL4]
MRPVQRILCFISVFLYCSCVLVAADLEDFTGGVTSTRVSENPASVALIGRNHIQYLSYSFSSSAIKPVYVEYFRVNDRETEIQGTDQNTEVKQIQYGEGTTNGKDLVVVTPFEYFSLGLGFTTQQSLYRDSVFLDENSNPIDEGSVYKATNAKYNKGATDYYLGIPFKTFSIGIKRQLWLVENNIQYLRFYQAKFSYDYLGAEDYFWMEDQRLELKAKSTYQTTEYGLLIPDALPGVDFGMVHRPEVDAKMEFKLTIHEASPAWRTEDFDYKVPAYTSIGFGYTVPFIEGIGLQLLGDLGQFSEIDTNEEGLSSSLGSQNGRLIRLVWTPLIDISYGFMTRELASITYEQTTTTVQIPFFQGNNLKLGSQRYRIINAEGKTIVDVTLVKISFNMQFGESTGSRRCGSVVPKQKELTFMDRLGACN